VTSLRVRALILAAGKGQRLRPLTQELPKPLLPVAGKAILCHTLDQLAAVGCEATAINLHHLGEQIPQSLGTSYAGIPLTYSREAELRGTLGALGPLQGFFSEADLILVINGDSHCRWPLRGLIREHYKKGGIATLLLSKRAEAERFGGGVGVDGEGKICSFRTGDEGSEKALERYVFAGAQVLSPALVNKVPPAGPSDLVQDLYLPLLLKGHSLQGWVTGRRWHDLGTPRRYLEGAIDAGRGPWPGRLWRRSWVSPRAEVAPRAKVASSVLEAGVTVAAEARVERSLVLEGARIEEGSMVKESVIGPGVQLPAGTWVERRLVVRQQRGQRLDRDDSLVGSLVFAPLRRPSEGEAP
jgi:mannose-1-phosphate guanylyltransferase